MRGCSYRSIRLGAGAVAAAVACTPEGEEPPWTCADRAVVTVEAAEDVALVQRVRVALEVPTEVVLIIDGVSVLRSPPAQTHDLPVYGRPDAVRPVRLALTCADRDPGVLGPFDVQIGGAPEPWPRIEVFADRSDLREPGLTLLDVGRPDGINRVAALEPDGVPVWAWASDTGKVLDSRIEPDGTVWVLTEEEIVRIDLFGAVLGRWRPAAKADGATPVDVLVFHHEVTPTPGGFVSLDNQVTAVDAYPITASLPNGPMAPADLIDPVVVDVAADGTLVGRWPLVERLDPQRLGWLALQRDANGFDWGHANAVVVDPLDGGLVVSVRHQDAIVKLDRTTGAVRWILANPDGWRAPWSALRLDPVGAVTWPSHQHAPMVTANPDGTRDVTVFDNGNFGRTTPYSGVDEGSFSRLVTYRVDEAANTVAEVWSFDQTTTGQLFSGAFGDADLLPATGNRLGVFGMMYREGEVVNAEIGRGSKSARLVEATPDGTVAWELSIWDAKEHASAGWQSHRAQRIPSLYPAPPPE